MKGKDSARVSVRAEQEKATTPKPSPLHLG